MKRLLFILLLILISLPLGFGKKKAESKSFNQEASKGVILLDFNGYKSEKDVWGYYEFSSSHLLEFKRTYIQLRIGQLFKDFDVVVTTDDSLFNSFPLRNRVKCVITNDTLCIPITSFICKYTAGFSPIGTVFTGDTTVSLVSSSMLENDVKYISEACAHEIGHALGLQHQPEWKDGYIVDEYDHGDIWSAPIMGSTYTSINAVWTKGVNKLGQIQDDTAVIGRTFRRLPK